MLRRFLIVALVTSFLLVSCGGQTSQPVDQDAPSASESPPEPAEAIPESTQKPEAGPDVAPDAKDCLEGEISPIGISIANEYEFTNYVEVITWFCSGAEFEDILVALESESQTNTPAEEMLQMLAAGFTWDEIWALVGLTE